MSRSFRIFAPFYMFHTISHINDRDVSIWTIGDHFGIIIRNNRDRDKCVSHISVRRARFQHISVDHTYVKLMQCVQPNKRKSVVQALLDKSSIWFISRIIDKSIKGLSQQINERDYLLFQCRVTMHYRVIRKQQKWDTEMQRCNREQSIPEQCIKRWVNIFIMYALVCVLLHYYVFGDGWFEFASFLEFI